MSFLIGCRRTILQICRNSLQKTQKLRPISNVPQVLDVRVGNRRCGNEIVLHARKIPGNDDALHRDRLRPLHVVRGERHRTYARAGIGGRRRRELLQLLRYHRRKHKVPWRGRKKKNAGRIKKLPLGNPMTARGTARKKKKKQKIKQLPFRHLPCAWTEGCGATIKNETFCAIPVTGAKCLWDFLWISSPSVQAPTSVVPTRMLMVVVLVEQLTVMTYLS